MKSRDGIFKAQLISIAALTMLCATSIHATMIDGIVDTWTVNVDTTFRQSSVEWQSGETPGTFVNNQLLTWGTGDQGASSLSISNSPSNQPVNTNGAAVANVSVTHANNPIEATSGELDKVIFDSILTLTPLVPSSAGLPAATLDFTVLFDETPNGDSLCLGGGSNGGTGINRNGCADVFVIDKDALNFSFFYDLDGILDTYQNQEYFISFFEESNALNALPDSACTTAGATSPCMGFLTAEKMTTTFNFAAVITTEPVSINVPEPSAIALMGLGLLGFGVTRRKIKK